MGSIGTTPYGRRLFPTHLDEIAKTNPGRVYAAIPKTADVKDGFLDVTISDLARCANFMARWLEDKYGKSQNFETINYVGLSDLRGTALFFGAMKTGYKVSTAKHAAVRHLTDSFSFSLNHLETRLLPIFPSWNRRDVPSFCIQLRLLP